MSLKKILSQLKYADELITLRKIKQNHQYYLVRNSQVDRVQKSYDEGIMIELYYKGHFAYSATNNGTIKGVQNAYAKAKENLNHSIKHSLYIFNESVRSGHQLVKEMEQRPFAIEVSRVLEILKKCTDVMGRKEKISASKAMVQMLDCQTEIISNGGTHLSFDKTYFDYSLWALGQGQCQGETQSRSWGNCGSKGLEFLDEALFLKQADQISEEAIELVNARQCEQEKADLLLMPDQMVLQLHESIGHPLELDRILGDERNYAGFSFVKASDFGHLKYGSDLLNVTFDPNIEGELASYQFDDTGQNASRKYLIKEGVLLRGIGASESQQRLGIDGVACSRATSWNRPPIDRMANINIEAGVSSFDKMISETQNGVLMYTNRSWSIDDYRNKFQFGCEYAKKIKNGKIMETLKNPNYRGISRDFWKSLKAVGDESTLEIQGSFYCGKGEPNQVIRVGHRVPACLFSNVEIFGGES